VPPVPAVPADRLARVLEAAAAAKVVAAKVAVARVVAAVEVADAAAATALVVRAVAKGARPNVVIVAQTRRAHRAKAARN
jgi:hypothetical protein